MNLKGYIFSRPFFGERVPQHVQNIVLRDYCQKKKINFLMSATEYSVSNSTYILFELIENLKTRNGIVFYSLFQLPIDKKLRFQIYKKIISKKSELHFAVENISAKNSFELQMVENIFLIKQSTFKDNVHSFGKKLKLVTRNHEKTKRNYIERMMENKIKCMKIAKNYDQKYWDGNRKYGYGGYKYIPGYHTELAKKLIKRYNLNNKSKILDLGCGKGYLLYEIKKILKYINITGIDISKYALKNSKKEIKKFLSLGDLNKKLKFGDKKFDLVISINTLHNLKINNLIRCLGEIERVGLSKFICVESYRNETEQFNLQCWALTAETIIDVTSWKSLFEISGYSGDYEFIYFK